MNSSPGSSWNIRRTFMAIRRISPEYCQAQHTFGADK